jgi:hypothetical protein
MTTWSKKARSGHDLKPIAKHSDKEPRFSEESDVVFRAGLSRKETAKEDRATQQQNCPAQNFDSLFPHGWATSGLLSGETAKCRLRKCYELVVQGALN